LAFCIQGFSKHQGSLALDIEQGVDGVVVLQGIDEAEKSKYITNQIPISQAFWCLVPN
jgi:hypothetical protein